MNLPLTTPGATRGGVVMDKDQIQWSFKQSSGRLKKASGELPGDETAGSAAHDGKNGKTANPVGDSKDTRRAIERWIKEGAA